MKKRGHEFERDQGGVNGSVLREKRCSEGGKKVMALLYYNLKVKEIISLVPIYHKSVAKLGRRLFSLLYLQHHSA